MQDQHHHIEQKFKEIEKSASPDLSNIDTHWQALQKDLVPSNTNPGRPKKFRWIYGPILLALLVPLIIIFSKKSPERNDSFRKEMISEEPTQEDTIPVRPSPTNKIGPTSGTNKLDTVSPPFVLVNSTTKEAKPDTIYLSSKPPRPPRDTIKIITKPVLTKPKKVIQIKARSTDGKDTVLNAIIQEERKEATEPIKVESSDTLYRPLQKPTLSSFINPTINKLVLPTASFTKILPKTLSITEYYSYTTTIYTWHRSLWGKQLLIAGCRMTPDASGANKPVRLKQGKSVLWPFPPKTAFQSDMKLIYGNIITISIPPLVNLTTTSLQGISHPPIEKLISNRAAN